MSRRSSEKENTDFHEAFPNFRNKIEKGHSSQRNYLCKGVESSVQVHAHTALWATIMGDIWWFSNLQGFLQLVVWCVWDILNVPGYLSFAVCWKYRLPVYNFTCNLD